MAVEGGVEIIGTLTPKNGKEFPIVMAKNVGFDDGSTLEEVVNDLKGTTVNKISVKQKNDINIKEITCYPFEEINKMNIAEFRLVRYGNIVFCSINASIEVPMVGKFDLYNFKIPEGYRPVNTARAYDQYGYWNFDVFGTIHLYSNSTGKNDRSISLCWISTDDFEE